MLLGKKTIIACNKSSAATLYLLSTNEDLIMPDGKRKRRHSANQAKRTWYALHRAVRFAKRFGWPNQPVA